MFGAGRKNGKRSLWKRIPLPLRMYIIGLVGFTALICLLVVSCFGGTEEELEEQAEETAKSFYFMWADGTTEEAYEFLTESAPKEIQTMEIVTKVELTLNSVSFYFHETPPNTLTVKITIPVLPNENSTETEIQYDYAVELDDDGYATFTFDDLSQTTAQAEHIKIEFSHTVVLESIAVKTT